MQLNSVSAYKASFHLSNYVWNIVLEWDYFTKDTIGKQFARAIDSISANIAEGFGRYSKKDKVKFYRYSSGSVKESQDWLEKANARNLLTNKQYAAISKELSSLPRQLNTLIKFTNNKLSI